ncbi:dihydropteroate synthase [Moraxella catarrhalis]|uniref:dihydropteroate synthase n=1 Tax=Moraxella catarrhalis TaxID=480 RepID=UPI00128BF1CD|nr:dihydropteroate synthase [Moraxella catarrhalis]MPW95671.1 dihydropteroate synthase [Moraxella catarrhalis]
MSYSMTKPIRHRNKVMTFDVPKVMGVLNMTPDSFSDGGRFNHLDAALVHAEQMIAYGVDIIDIGGESTRPYAPKVSTDEELERVIPIIAAIRENFGEDLWLSVDTSDPAVMLQAIGAGADIVNDVRGLSREGACDMVADLECPVVIMHSRGTPDTMTQTMNELTSYNDVLAEISTELQIRIDKAMDAGIRQEKIIIDIGMGFSKNYEHHIQIMQNLQQIIQHFQMPMLFGVSRKRFLGEVLTNSGLEYLKNHQPIERDNLGTLAHFIALQQGVHIVRVHDVKPMAQAVRLWQALYG